MLIINLPGYRITITVHLKSKLLLFVTQNLQNSTYKIWNSKIKFYRINNNNNNNNS